MAFTKDVSLNSIMRELWKVHVELTRSVILGIVKGTDISVSEKKLLDNQIDIGQMFQPKYGEKIAQAVTQLLQDHICIAGRLVTAAQQHQNESVVKEKYAWFQNADDIAKTLSQVNLTWDYLKIKNALDMHLGLTLDEALAEIKGDRKKGLQYYISAWQQINQIADALSLGLLQTIALHGQHLMGILY